ncbi:hypothetical protein TCAL_01701 [Tigriopus californicus]|uniref:Uncharacterized protein n=1 Tax=Tigriopus californicus TaxID=6832 RepID=A0A553PMI7_TIGCA|nr:acetyl-CoA carboxylase 1-like [Tigriopus californicus]TRY78898.1 hypothetical protein TCAL_01701 [Tigriopus californicus]|eukprot:TCALIF_01701-PA protein Name:"Similar to ACAC Acetyl-CoA carboxylase (Gallus gallus)" AED:0.03 eAED:0.03 QI:292/1/1/1/1/1/5/200/2321
MASSQSPDSSSNPSVSSSSSPSNVVNGHLNNAHRMRVTMSLADMKQVQTPTSTSNEEPPTSPMGIPSSNLRGMDHRRGSLATPEEFVRKFQGKRAINKVLIANNGIAAVKCIRSIRRWSYENFPSKERAIKFVVMVTPEDLKANAEYIKMADYVCQVKGGSNNNNYANVDLILNIAKRYNVEAVWAGWGHASENPKLPEMLSKNNIMFMGPNEHAMWLLGDKIASSIVAQTAGIPTMPWSGSGLVADYVEGTKVKVSKELFRQACVKNLEEGLKAAQKIGFPVMIKASEGGGGKGIRKAECEDDFKKQYPQVQLEVPGSPVFIMKLARNARHLEVQLLADEYGNAISLFGRDCSIQRRHQKIIEEAPVVIAKPEIFKEMEKAAVRLAEMVGYRSTGTVEYLYDDTGRWYFLELNPRLQVEHPCTEMVANVNLPASQLMVAMGIPLHRMKSIRQLYGRDGSGSDPIDFKNPTHPPRPNGHVIAARITSENPDEGFKPSAGTVHELNFKSNKNVWGYFSVSASGGLHEFADSQFGHCFSWGEDREQARENLVVALKELSIRGDFRTIVEHLVMILEKSEFLYNSLNTGWLDCLIAKKEQADKPDLNLSLICGALNVADEIISSNFQSFKAFLDRGQTQPATFLKNSTNVDLIFGGFKYTMRTTKTGPTQYMVELNGTMKEVDVHHMTDGQLLVSVDGLTHTTYMHESADQYRVVVGNQTVVFEKENDPSMLMSPSTGKLLKYLVADGDHIRNEEPYAEMEVMKMVTTLHVKESGVITFCKRPGAILESGSTIAKLSLDDPAQCKRAEAYMGPGFPSQGDDVPAQAMNLSQGYIHAKQTLDNALAGYCCPDEHFKDFIEKTINDLMMYLKDPKLPLDEMKEVMASIQGRIPYKVERPIIKALSMYEQNITSVLAQFPAQKITTELTAYLSSVDPKDKDIVELTIQPIIELCNRYKHGVKGQMKHTVCDLIQRYLDVEKLFQVGHYDKVVSTMREMNKDNIDLVVERVFAHTQYRHRNMLITALLDTLWAKDPRMIKSIKQALLSLTDLVRPENATVLLKARTILIASEKPSYELRHNHMEKMFLDAINKTEDMHGDLQKMITDDSSIFDVLGDFFYHNEDAVKGAALEVYVRRAFTSYEVTGLTNLRLDCSQYAVKFDFLLPQSHPNRSYHRVRNMTRPASTFMPLPEDCQRHGVMTAFSSFEEFQLNFDDVLDLFYQSPPLSPYEDGNRFAFHHVGSPNSFDDRKHSEMDEESKEPMNILNIAIKIPKTLSDDKISEMFHTFCSENHDDLVEKKMRRITFIVLRPKEFPKYFTYRARTDFGEDLIYRHLEPALAFQLELNRLKNYDLESIPTSNHKMRLYLGKAKVAGGREVSDYRFFIRSIIRHSDLVTTEASFEYLKNEGERLLLESLDELEVAFTHPMAKKTDGNHIFLNFVPTVNMDPLKIAEDVQSQILTRYAPRLMKLKVKFAEIRMAIRQPSQQKSSIFRLCISNDAGYILSLQLYREVTDPQTGVIKFISFGLEQGPWHGLPVSTPYMTKDFLETKRSKAQALETTFVYDYPDIFKVGLKEAWRSYAKRSGSTELIPKDSEMFQCTELVLTPDESKVIERKRYPGENSIAMVAWKMSMKTPEYPEGRDIIVIANDITINIGSFGPKEDILFLRASELARKLKIPRIYLAANSGARIGLAKEVMELFRVAWEDPDDPEKGFKYLYLTSDDYLALKDKSSEPIVHTELIQEEGESRFKITDIVGQANDIGVENLSAAGLIAGETSQAYQEVVTISMTTARAIGIGAYLVRLGQRVVQIENSAIILTGASALNKLLGREVYTSNTQLGGVQIMYNNGVTHKTERNDIDGIRRILKWLSYVPKHNGASLPMVIAKDPVSRQIGYYPPQDAAYDPRWLLEGYGEGDDHLPGFFDRGSFDEIMSMWAQSVVTGRAQLGGIPVGVIAVETRTIELELPADPANPDSEAKVISQAGQVWFPDSAFKTAQAIYDFNKEELPLIVFANWRGFSGGMKDMYEQVIKFGAMIVDALHAYNQPILIYIPPFGELRGGSWVVIDPTINERQMEMYADPNARGGVLEAEGIVSIKMRMKEQRLVMQRLDLEMNKLGTELKSLDLIPDRKAEIEVLMKKREEILAPMFHQVSVQFADLHDTPTRMKDKGVIRDIIPWADARSTLFWRLRRRLLEADIKKKMSASKPLLQDGHAQEMLRRWFIEDQGENNRFLWEQDKPSVDWLSTQVKEDGRSSVVRENLKLLRRETAFAEFKKLLNRNPDLLHEVGVHLAQKMTAEKRSEFLEAVSKIQEDDEPQQTLETTDDSSENGDI